MTTGIDEQLDDPNAVIVSGGSQRYPDCKFCGDPSRFRVTGVRRKMRAAMKRGWLTTVYPCSRHLGKGVVETLDFVRGDR